MGNHGRGLQAVFEGLYLKVIKENFPKSEGMRLALPDGRDRG